MRSFLLGCLVAAAAASSTLRQLRLLEQLSRHGLRATVDERRKGKAPDIFEAEAASIGAEAMTVRTEVGTMRDAVKTVFQRPPEAELIAGLLEQRTSSSEMKGAMKGAMKGLDAPVTELQLRQQMQPMIQHEDTSWKHLLVPADKHLLVPAGKQPRQLLGGIKCTNHTECTANEYCMNCQKCWDYHHALPRDEQKRWTCHPCGGATNGNGGRLLMPVELVSTGGHCESGRYCKTAKDSQSGECPVFPGCSKHSECPENEYCYDCTKCKSYFDHSGREDKLWECEPCPTSTGGFCGIIAWCNLKKDSIDGDCPRRHGCDSHTDCWDGQYCESCEGCQTYQQSLAVPSMWTCSTCPTIGGGFCEQLRFCQTANDGIDGTCPEHRGCASNEQCLPTEYCSDCVKCEAHRETLPLDEQASWTCEPCPTQRGGVCRARQFCSVANDTVTPPCPAFQGCGEHEDCGSKEFCLSYIACKKELGTNCGSTPEKGGVCFKGSLCRPERSIDTYCPIPPTCGGHAECSGGYFCAPWSDCIRRDPTQCGPKPFHVEGVCMPLQHCRSGLHSSVDGSCPSNPKAGGKLHLKEALRFNDTLQLATHFQAMNVWSFTHGRSGATSPRLVATLGVYPGYTGGIAPRGTIEVAFLTKGRDKPPKVTVFYTLTGLPPSSSGGLHIHTGITCASDVEVGSHYWSLKAGMPTDDPWKPCKWTSQADGTATGSFDLISGFDYRYNSGRAVVVHDADSNRIACGLLGEELLLAQLRDYGNQSDTAKDNTEYVGIYRSAYGQLHEHRLPKLSCPSVEIAIPQKPGFFYEARIHLTELEMSMQHAECSCVTNEVGACPRGAHYKMNPRTAPEEGAPITDMRMQPVVFASHDGLPMLNELTLYTITSDIVKEAVMIDSSLDGVGEGEPSLGCPYLDHVSFTPSLAKLAEDKKVLPQGHVTGVWCVVRLGLLGAEGCSPGSKYKLCLVSGAIGVIFIAEKQMTDEELIVIKTEVEMGDMIPAICMHYDQTFVDTLRDPSAEKPEVSAGPTIYTTPSANFVPTAGGIRVYDVDKAQWNHHPDVFGGTHGTQEWMEFSPVRDVLFACTSQYELIALDASAPTTAMPRLGSLPGMTCHQAPRYRDYHVADFRQGDKFFTVVIDPSTVTNRLYFYDTTDLSNWVKLSELHANWEHETSGLGQVIVTPDAKFLLVAWACSTMYCGGKIEGKGERLYVLNLTDVVSGKIPDVLSVIDMPMTEGSIVRDIACDFEGICLASLTWDGIVAVDLYPGPNQFKIVAQHSALSERPSIPSALTYFRLAAGAQKLVPSATHPRRFYVEHWSLDVAKCLAGATLMECARFDTIWIVDFEGYERPLDPPNVDPVEHDPSVHATLRLDISMDELLKQIPAGKVDGLESWVADAIQKALNVDAGRILVTGAMSSPDRKSVLVSFHIVPGSGAAPDTLFDMLVRQLEAEGSAFRTGSMANYTTGAQLTATRRKGGSGTPGKPGKPGGKPPRGPEEPHTSSTTHVLILLIVAALGLIVAAWAVAFAWRSKRTARLATARANEMHMLHMLHRQTPEDRAVANMMANARTPPGPGFVVGRPDPSATAVDTEATEGCRQRGAAASAAGSDVVVGRPISPTRSGAAAAASGTALNDIDQAKMVTHDNQAASSDASSPASSAASRTFAGAHVDPSFGSSAGGKNSYEREVALDNTARQREMVLDEARRAAASTAHSSEEEEEASGQNHGTGSVLLDLDEGQNEDGEFAECRGRSKESLLHPSQEQPRSGRPASEQEDEVEGGI